MTSQPLPDLDEQALLAHALESIATAIFIADRQGRVIWANDAFCRLSGYERHEILGQTPSFLKSGLQDADFYRHLWQTIEAGKVWHGEVINRSKNGNEYRVDEIVTPLIDCHGSISHFIAIQNQIAIGSEEASHHRFLAYHDALTGLPNRVLFGDQLRLAIERCRDRQDKLAVLFIDLDRFKPVNDTYGHAVGDQLLVAVARRLQAAVRSVDVIARLSGDEFAAFVVQLRAGKPAQSLARKLVAVLSKPFQLGRYQVEIGASIGIAIYPDHGLDPDTLIDHADTAMYRAKAAGRGGWCLFGEK